MANITIPRSVAVLVFSAVFGSGVWILMKVFKKKYQPVGRIKKIFIYPVKSLAGIEVTKAECTEFGLKHELLRDREFLISIEKENKFISMREEPTLSLVNTSYSDGKLFIDSAEKATLTIDLASRQDDSTEEVKEIDLWGRMRKCVDCGDGPAAWFSEYLNKSGIRLVRVLFDRDLESQHNGKGLFHDTASYNILSEASIENLNLKLEETVTYKRFRPNFLIEGTLPNHEDYWRQVKVSEATWSFFCRCDRCVMTTVIPETGIKTNNEPLKTLRQYRVDRSMEAKKKYKLSPLFGVLFTLVRPGIISANSEVYAYVESKPLL